MKKGIAYVVGTLFVVLGLLLIGAYIWSAIIEQWGKPDQSLIFWMAIFPLMGGPLVFCGIGLIILAARYTKQG